MHGSGNDGPLIISKEDIENLSQEEISRAFLDTKDLPNDQVAPLISSHPNIGIVLYGGVEEKVGYKSFDEQDALIDLLMDD